MARMSSMACSTVGVSLVEADSVISRFSDSGGMPYRERISSNRWTRSSSYMN